MKDRGKDIRLDDQLFYFEGVNMLWTRAGVSRMLQRTGAGNLSTGTILVASWVLADDLETSQNPTTVQKRCGQFAIELSWRASHKHSRKDC